MLLFGTPLANGDLVIEVADDVSHLTAGRRFDVTNVRDQDDLKWCRDQLFFVERLVVDDQCDAARQRSVSILERLFPGVVFHHDEDACTLHIAGYAR